MKKIILIIIIICCSVSFGQVHSIFKMSKIDTMLTALGYNSADKSFNFKATIPLKLNADASIRLGGTYGGVPTLAVKDMQASDYSGFISFQLNGKDDEYGDWRVGHTQLDWDPTHYGKEMAYTITYNINNDPDMSIMSFGMEPNYELVGQATNIYEWWYEFSNSVTREFTCRPLQVAAYVPYDNYDVDNISMQAGFVVDKFSFGAPIHAGGTTYAIEMLFYEDNGITPNYINIVDSLKLQYRRNGADWLFQEAYPEGGGGVSMIKVDQSNSVAIYPSGPGDPWNMLVRIGSQSMVGIVDSVSVNFGKFSQETSGIGFFSGGSSYVKGGFYYNDDNNLFGIVARVGPTTNAKSWYDAISVSDEYSSADFFLGGNLLIGTKTDGSGWRTIALASGTAPSTVSGQLGIYNDAGVLKVKNPSGTIYSLTGSANFDNVSTTTGTGKVTSGFYNTNRIVTVNNSTPVSLATGTSFIAFMRDISAGGSCLISYENGGTPTIISGGTPFVLTSPGASEIQLIGGGSQEVTAQGGSGKNGAQVQIIVLRAQE